MSLKSYSIISGGIHNDERGSIRFVNDFNMNLVKRFYNIIHKDTSTIRAWQGHQKEQKWFHCLEGEFELYLLKVDQWDNPSKDLKPNKVILEANTSQIIHVPGGFVNGFRATINNSSLMVFSNFSVAESTDDDFRFDKNYWAVWQNKYSIK